MEVWFMSQTLSVITLLIISSFAYIFSKKINFPYTVFLVIVWIILIPISKIWFFWFIDDFELTPEVLFYVFLPILLFESAYNIKYKQLVSNWKSVSILAIIWLLISSFIIAGLMFFVFPFFWLNIPFLVCLLFWSLISATDPVAVLAIFKSLWAPRRLTIIFEWESLFNDWTAVALFSVILSIIVAWWNFNEITALEWVWKFFSMVFGWILFWAFTWVLFSKVLWKITNNEEAEIVLTMLMAHVTFILSELITHHFHFLPISWVISTVIASLIVWNYWRYKITPRVEAHMQKFWEFFAFIANSMIFILLGLWMAKIELKFLDFALPIASLIVIVMIARAISVYLPLFSLNSLKLEQKIPVSWMHLLSWWSLRWALALIMVLLIPDNLTISGWDYIYSIKDFLLLMTLACIGFTLFIKATTTPAIMRAFWVDKLHDLEKFEYEEWKILTNLKVLEKLKNSYEKWYLTDVEYSELRWKYSNKLNEAVKEMKELIKNDENKIHDSLIKKAISIHSLWIEKQYLKELFYYNEIDEKNFKHILRKIERQIERLEEWKEQLKNISQSKIDYDIFTKFMIKLHNDKSDFVDKYIIYRTRAIVTRKVIKDLKSMKDTDLWFDKNIFDEIIELYEDFNLKSNEKRLEIFKKHEATINALESRLVNKSMLKLEEKTIEDLNKKEMITPKLYLKFKEEIEEEMFADVKVMN